MRRHPWALGGLALLLTVLPLSGGATATAADPPVRAVSLTGPDVTVWPEYDAALTRFAIGTGAATDGRVTVTASTTDPQGSVAVDGRPVANGAETPVEGLEPGDEVNVTITDAAGTTSQSFLYLPTGFPRIRAEQQGTGPTEGHVFLGLAGFLSESTYETVVDAQGVPVHVATGEKTHDLKPSGAGDGHYTVARLLEGSTNDDAGYRIDELGARFQLLRSHTLVPVRSLGLRRDDTDFHDVQLLPDGRMVLIGYHRDERRSGRTWLDAVIQVVGADGRPDLTWTSKGEVKPREGYVLGARGQDYAHINSVEMQRNGDLVASFRNTGQVLRIATRRHHGHRPGDVVWRLGGERNEFTFVDDPYGGFCAQHSARMLAGGHLLLFDNGAQQNTEGPLNPQTADMCPDPADPGGERVARPQSRVAEYALDVADRTATLVWSYEVPGRYATFAGNTERLAGGGTLVGWWNAQDLTAPETPVPFVSEVDPGGTEVWNLTAQGWFSYRAHHGAAPDRIRPRVQVQVPRPGATYAVGEDLAASYTCTDRGGSNLAACAGDLANGEPLDTSAGTHTVRVEASDGAGNTRTRTVTYTVG